MPPIITVQPAVVTPIALNLAVAWLSMLAGAVSGAVQGLFFQNETWLGGYGSWPRRIMRLGHLACFGLALVNVAFVATVGALAAGSHQNGATTWGPHRDGAAICIASIALIAGNVLMPLVCYLSAWRRGLARLFFLPVGCVLVGIIAVLMCLWS